MRKLSTIIALLLLAAIVPGCDWFDGDSPVAPPPPVPCDLIMQCTPIAGANKFYFCSTNEPQQWIFVRNGTQQSVEFGGVVSAGSGDLVQACATGCGCTLTQVLR